MQLFKLQGAPLLHRGTQKQELDKVVEILMQTLAKTESSTPCQMSSAASPPISSPPVTGAIVSPAPSPIIPQSSPLQPQIVQQAQPLASTISSPVTGAIVSPSTPQQTMGQITPQLPSSSSPQNQVAQAQSFHAAIDMNSNNIQSTPLQPNAITATTSPAPVEPDTPVVLVSVLSPQTISLPEPSPRPISLPQGQNAGYEIILDIPSPLPQQIGNDEDKNEDKLEERGIVRRMQGWIAGLLWSPFKWMWTQIKKLVWRR